MMCSARSVKPNILDTANSSAARPTMPLASSLVLSTVSRIIPSAACSIWLPLATTTLAGSWARRPAASRTPQDPEGDHQHRDHREHRVVGERRRLQPQPVRQDAADGVDHDPERAVAERGQPAQRRAIAAPDRVRARLHRPHGRARSEARSSATTWSTPCHRPPVPPTLREPRHRRAIPDLQKMDENARGPGARGNYPQRGISHPP